MLLSSEIHQLRTFISIHDMKDENISSQSIGWHIEHSLKVINKVCIQLLLSNPRDYHWKFNPLLMMHLLRGSIPRGKSKAPLRLIPSYPISSQNLIEQLELATKNLEKIEKLTSNHFCRHPYYGVLNLRQTSHFLKLHTLHHLKIIDEIEYNCIYSHELTHSH